MEQRFAILLSDFKGRAAKLKKQLEEVGSETMKSGLKEEIISFYKELAGYVRELLILQESIRSVAEKFRAIKLPEELEQDARVKSFFQRMRTPRVDILTLVDKGWNDICMGAYDDAVSVLTKATRLAPEDTKALGLLGWAHVYKENYDEALSIYQKVLSLDPENCLAICNVGYMYYRKGMPDKAMQYLSKVIKLNKDRTATLYAHYYFGLIYLENKMFDNAIGFFKKAIQLSPNLMEAYYHLGLACDRSGAEGEALEVWKHGAARLPHNPWALRCKEEIDRRSEGAEGPGDSG